VETYLQFHQAKQVPGKNFRIWLEHVYPHCLFRISKKEALVKDNIFTSRFQAIILVFFSMTKFERMFYLAESPGKSGVLRFLREGSIPSNKSILASGALLPIKSIGTINASSPCN
jgi:hypothetical protein